MFAAARAPSTMLRARPAVDLLVKARPAARMFHQSPKMGSMPKDPHSAHTVSQRIRQGVKAIPVEIYPLVAVITLGLSFGVYSFIRPGLEDPTLRLHRSRPDDRH
ncbi:hypothetical protein UCDDS831_g08533 [Diplodia seriata]|uniref:Uncharacterized protein n=1 Tax=Diplodia seriata TaxID=420778 RepID=A0A0G2FPY1_9PEZI|nr:hypothetical protein UCDDS831_g08533 [Diplodia seriata]